MGVNMHDSHVVVCKERTIKELPQNADQLLFQPMFVLLYEFLFFAGFIRKKWRLSVVFPLLQVGSCIENKYTYYCIVLTTCNMLFVYMHLLLYLTCMI